MAREPVEGRRQPRAPIQLRGLAAARLPLTGGLGEVLAELPPLGVFLQPPPQTRPLPEQGLVRHLDRVLGHREETVLRELREDRRRDWVAIQIELLEPDGPLRHGLALAGGDEPQEDGARGVPLGVGELLVGRLRQPGHSAPHPPGPLVGVQADPAAVPVLPQLHKRGREQRQPAGLVGDLLDDGVDERGLEAEPGPARRELDRAAELLARERADQHVVRREPLGELRIRRAVCVVVAPDPEDDRHALGPSPRGAGELVDELDPLLFAGARGEGLLELVDHQDEASVRGGGGENGIKRGAGVRPQRAAQLPHGTLARTHRGLGPLLAPGEQPGAERWQQASGDDRATTEDFPLPDAPTTPRRADCTVRAANSPTSRSRPKNRPASSSSNGASPLYGQASVTSASRPSTV